MGLRRGGNCGSKMHCAVVPRRHLLLVARLLGAAKKDGSSKEGSRLGRELHSTKSRVDVSLCVHAETRSHCHPLVSNYYGSDVSSRIELTTHSRWKIVGLRLLRQRFSAGVPHAMSATPFSWPHLSKRKSSSIYERSFGHIRRAALRRSTSQA